MELWVTQVLVTLGEKGSLLVTKLSHVHVPPVRVQAVDTTGAGDCFLGSFAYFLSQGNKYMHTHSHHSTRTICMSMSHAPARGACAGSQSKKKTPLKTG